MKNGRRVVITGMGPVTPVGIGLDNFWNALKEGKSGAGPITQFDASDHSTRIAAEVKDFDPSLYADAKELRRMDRFVQLAVAAAKLALDDSGLDLEKADRDRIGVCVGSGIGGTKTWELQHSILLEKGPSRVSPMFVPMLIANMASGHISILHQLRGPNTAVVTACATGSHCISDAAMIIALGAADVMLTGGTEASVTSLAMAGFCNMKAMTRRNDDPQRASRPFDKERDGFLIGEGAGVLVLEDLDHAKKRGARIYAEIAGFGMSADAFSQFAPEPEGAGGYLSMKAALESAEIQPEDVDYINAHGTSTPDGDIAETIAIKRTFGSHAKKLAVSSSKSMVGHLLGAAGAVEAIACAMTITEGIIHPTINYEYPDPECDLDYVPNEAREANVNVALSNSFGFGGHNATIILKKFNA